MRYYRNVSLLLPEALLLLSPPLMLDPFSGHNTSSWLIGFYSDLVINVSFYLNYAFYYEHRDVFSQGH